VLVVGGGGSVVLWGYLVSKVFLNSGCKYPHYIEGNRTQGSKSRNYNGFGEVICSQQKVQDTVEENLVCNQMGK
jgi:hypothetical protein